jgi:hypothetical protein
LSSSAAAAEAIAVPPMPMKWTDLIADENILEKLNNEGAKKSFLKIKIILPRRMSSNPTKLQLFAARGVDYLRERKGKFYFMNWKKFLALAAVAGMGLTASATAQSTNIIRADIEQFEAQTNLLIVKGLGTGGSVDFGTAVMAVRLKDSFNPDTGRRLQGIVINFADGDRHERATIDYDELDPLLRAMDYIRAASYDVSSLPSFEAVYQTKDGFRVIGLGSHRQSSVQHFVQFDDCARIPLNSEQIARLRGVISQARNALDELRPAK